VRDYFTDHLPHLRGMSHHTIQSYRDSLVLLLRFLSTRRNRPLAELDLTDLDPPSILAFLTSFFHTIKVIAAIFLAKVRRAIVGFLPFASKFS
jgi:site-specific recombinase XerD